MPTSTKDENYEHYDEAEEAAANALDPQEFDSTPVLSSVHDPSPVHTPIPMRTSRRRGKKSSNGACMPQN